MPGRLDTPAPLHAQVAAEHETAFEVEQEVLADGADALEPEAVEPLGQLQDGGARVRGLDGDDLALEGPQALGGTMERVALRAR